MMFAMVDLGNGVLEPVKVSGALGDRLRVERLTGESKLVSLVDVAHCGATGGDEIPVGVYQFCPAWLDAQMRRFLGGRQGIAANLPKKKESTKQRIAGANYLKKEIKWTPKARQDRWDEQSAYQAAMQPGLKSWSALHVVNHFGYMEVARFIESYANALNPETYFWAIVFGILTASEGTDRAEENFYHISKHLRSLRAKGLSFGEIASRGVTQKEFARDDAGFQDQRWKYFVLLLREYDLILRFIEDQKTLLAGTPHSQRGTLLRRALVKECARKDATFRIAGLGVTKMSFALEICGENVACLDRWMMRALGATEPVGGKFFPDSKAAGPADMLKLTNKRIGQHQKYYQNFPRPGVTRLPRTHEESGLPYVVQSESGKPDERYFGTIPPPPWSPFTDGSYVLSEHAGNRMGEKNPTALKEYEWWEERLKSTEYYKLAVAEGAPNPLARAQWTQWEDVLRYNIDSRVQREKANHAEVFWIIEDSKLTFQKFEELILRKARPFRGAVAAVDARTPRLLKNPRERYCDQAPCVGDTVRFSEAARKRHEVGSNLFEVVEERAGSFIVYSLDGNGTERRMVLPSELVVVSRSNPITYPVQEERIIVTNPMEPIADKAGDPMGVVKGAQLVPLWPSAARKTWGKIQGPQDVWNLLKDSNKSPVERMYVMILDRRNAVLGVFVAGQGTASEAIVGIRETFAPAIELRASGIVMAHNHPSGDPAPSSADIALTSRMSAAGEILGIAVIDSVVLGKDSFRSMREDGLMSSVKPNPRRRMKPSHESRFCDYCKQYVHDDYHEHVKRCSAKSAPWPDYLRNPSKSQRRLFGAALAYKRGESKSASEAAKRLARTVPEATLREFASRL